MPSTNNDSQDEKTSITDRFVEDIYALRHTDLSETAWWHAKRCLLDYLGATYAGSRMIRDKLIHIMDDIGGTEPVAPVIGFRKKASLVTAALVNGISSHAAELDDGVISGIVHPGTPILSALLPVASKYRVEGIKLLLGIISGYEATVRIANAIQPSHKLAGYHATATCGGIGAAIGILMMTDASKDVIKNALSAAAVSAGGSLKVLEDGSQLKPFNSGHAALSGVLAVAMARAGFMGPNDVMSGAAGFLKMMAASYDSAALFPDKGSALCIEKVYFKPYAACRYCHPAIDASFQIRANNRIKLEDIESIRVQTYELAVRHHDHTAIDGVSSAKMSIPFSVAVAMVNGTAGADDFSENTVHDEQILELARKVVVMADDGLTEQFPKKTAAIVEVVMVDGQRHVGEVDQPKGEPENPLTDDEVNEKFTSLAIYGGLSRGEIDRIRDSIWNLPKQAGRLYELL